MTRFVLNPKFFPQMANAPETRRILEEVAGEGKAIAEGLSESFRSDKEHEHYADSFEVTGETIDWTGEYPGPRAAARLTNTAPYAAGLEFGNEHVSNPKHVLRDTLAFLDAGGK